MQKSTWIVIAIVLALAVSVAYAVGRKSNSTAQPTSAASTTAPAVQPISISQVDIENLKLGCAIDGTVPNCGPGGFVLTGEVTNNSQTPFEGIYLTVEGYDCPGSTITSDCTHVAEAKWAELVVAGGVEYENFSPGFTKEATAAGVDLSGIPPIQGNFLWSYEITPCTESNTFACGFWNGYETIPATQ